jgi:hypothetical protein
MFYGFVSFVGLSIPSIISIDKVVLLIYIV